MKKQLKKGFTLTELVIVIVIIAILAAVLIPSMTGYVNRAKKSNAQSEASSVYTIYAAWLADIADNGGAEKVTTVAAGDTVESIAGLESSDYTTVYTAKVVLNVSGDKYIADEDSDSTTDDIAVGTVLDADKAQKTKSGAAIDLTLITITYKYTLAGATKVNEKEYAKSFAKYYATANGVEIADGATTVKNLTFNKVSLKGFDMESSNGYEIMCVISSGAPEYTIAESASAVLDTDDLD